MLIAKITNPVPVDYKQAFPDTSFPQSGPSDDFLNAEGYAKVNAFKEHDRETQNLVISDPYYEAPWVYTVRVETKTAEEIAAEQAVKAEQIQKEIVDSTQQRLDTFTKTRNYDGILSACTYATSTVVKFQVEGQYCVDARDNTWATLYQIMQEVQQGARPAPSGYADIEADLPALVWPN